MVKSSFNKDLILIKLYYKGWECPLPSSIILYRFPTIVSIRWTWNCYCDSSNQIVLVTVSITLKEDFTINVYYATNNLIELSFLSSTYWSHFILSQNVYPLLTLIPWHVCTSLYDSVQFLPSSHSFWSFSD
jgi:hypothetical protein